MARIGPYDPSLVTCSLGGILVEGFADDSFVTLEQSEATYEIVVGVDGQAIRVFKSGSLVWNCTLSMMQVAPVNLLLGALHQLDKDAPNGAGIVPFSVVDAGGTTQFATTTAWISTPAPITFGSGHNAKNWLVTAVDPSVLNGGN